MGGFEASRTSLILLENININNEEELFEVFLDKSLDEEKIRLIVQKLQKYLKTQCSWEKVLISMMEAIYSCIEKFSNLHETPFVWLLLLTREHSTFLASEARCKRIITNVYQKILKEEGIDSNMAKQFDVEIGKMVSREIICECVLDDVINKPLKTKQVTEKISNEKEKVFEIESIDTSSSSSTNVTNDNPILVLDSGTDNVKEGTVRKDQLNLVDKQNTAADVLESIGKETLPDKWPRNSLAADVGVTFSYDNVLKEEIKGQDSNTAARIGPMLHKEQTISQDEKKKIPDSENTFYTKDQSINTEKRKHPFDFYVRPFNGSKLTIQKFVIFRTSKKTKVLS